MDALKLNNFPVLFTLTHHKSATSVRFVGGSNAPPKLPVEARRWHACLHRRFNVFVTTSRHKSINQSSREQSLTVSLNYRCYVDRGHTQTELDQSTRVSRSKLQLSYGPIILSDLSGVLLSLTARPRAQQDGIQVSDGKIN